MRTLRNQPNKQTQSKRLFFIYSPRNSISMKTWAPSLSSLIILWKKTNRVPFSFLHWLCSILLIVVLFLFYFQYEMTEKGIGMFPESMDEKRRMWRSDQTALGLLKRQSNDNRTLYGCKRASVSSVYILILLKFTFFFLQDDNKIKLKNLNGLNPLKSFSWHRRINKAVNEHTRIRRVSL